MGLQDLAFFLPMSFRGLRMVPKKIPEETERAPKTVPRSPETAPDDVKTTLQAAGSAHDGPETAQDCQKTAQTAPQWPHVSVPGKRKELGTKKYPVEDV